jgi:hypothetical protein
MMYKIDVSNRKVIDDSVIESLPASDIPEANADSDDLSFVATKAPKSSKFIGVTYLKGDNRYKAQIRVEKKMYSLSLGQYKMESDAACCYDQTLRALCLADKRTTNFVSFDQYKAAREAEEKIRGENTEGIIKVASHIQHQVDKVVANVESNRNAVSDKAGVDRAENETEGNSAAHSAFFRSYTVTNLLHVFFSTQRMIKLILHRLFRTPTTRHATTQCKPLV